MTTDPTDNDPLQDPRFPDRPQHPDFWRMVAAVNYLDGEALEGGRSTRDIVDQYVDHASLVYLAQQRFMRMVQQADSEMDVQDFALAMYMDAFCLGVQFTREAKP